MSELIYPNLFLFLYDLREGFGEDQKDLENNQKIFANKLPLDIRKSLFNLDNFLESEYQELLPNKKQDFQNIPKNDKTYEGYYYPVRINDTYGLLLACSFLKDSTPYSPDCIANLKAKIELHMHGQTATLGQTWLVLAQIANSNTNPEDIAKKCCQALNLSLKWEKPDLQGQGEILGGKVFELQRYQVLMQKSQLLSAASPSIEQIQQSQHLIIALYSNEKTAKKAAELNFDWLRLFCYRHKIIWAYSQSRYIKQQLINDSSKINQTIKKIKTSNLKQLRKSVINAQNILPQYTTNLNYLRGQIHTIEVNLLNYSRRLEIINERLTEFQTKAGEEPFSKLLPNAVTSWLKANASLPINTNQLAVLAQVAKWQNDCNLDLLEKFSEKTAKKYQLQAQKDYENLSLGLQLLQDSINSSRAIIEIDQAERDRTFQYWGGILGVGLAASALGVSVAIDKLDKNSHDDPVRIKLNEWVLSTKPPQTPHPWWFEPVIPLIYGVGLGFAGAVLFALVLCAIGCWKRSTKT